MSFTTTEIMQSKRSSPPDFSFPPKQNQTSSGVTPLRQRIAIKSPPNFGFPIISPLGPVTKSVPQPSQQQNQSLLLCLPMEIRLQIYADVLNTHPIFHAHLAPSPQSQPTSLTTITELHTGILQPLGHSLPSSSVFSTSESKTRLNTRGKIPTGLLASCQQVYEETHLLPFEKNTFNFINWFWSGVYASRQFTRGLRDWQAEGMRWVGVEVLTRDLISSLPPSSTAFNSVSAGTDWTDLCTLWKGVWGLKLCIKGSISGTATTNPLPLGGMMVEGLFARPGELPQMDFETGERGLLDVNCEWVTKGLYEMRQLRWVEIEIEDGDVERAEKVKFCEELERVLNAVQREGDRTRVVFVEQRSEVSARVKEGGKFIWFGGAPVGEDED